MLPDQGCYEERYRLTGAVAWGLAIPLLLLVPAVLGSQPIGWLILSLAGLAIVTLPSVLAVASRRTAFRADYAGITLGADPLRGPARHMSAVLIPWVDVERIILYRGPATRGLAVQASSAARAPRHCPGATSPLVAARCLAWQPGQPGRSPLGGWTATASPLSPPQWHLVSRSSMPVLTRPRALKSRTRQAASRS